MKLFQQKFLTRTLCVNYSFLRARASIDNIPGLCCQIRKGHYPKRYLQSRHCFADSCKLERGRRCGQCVLDRTCLYATPILHYIAACAWFRQRIREIISTKCSKTAIRENLDPRKFSAIWYICHLPHLIFMCVCTHTSYLAASIPSPTK